MTSNGDMRKLLRQLEGQDWKWRQSKKGGHYICDAPNGQRVVMSKSPSCHRMMLNAKAQLRKACAVID